MFTVLQNGIEYPINHIQTMRRDLELNTAHELNMIVVNRENNPAYPYLQEEAILLVSGHEYRIKSVSEKTSYKNINALHIVTDLSEVPFNQKLNGNHSPATLFNTLLSGTGWTIQYNGTGADTSITLRDFGRDNVWKLFQDLCKQLKLEFVILPNKVFKVQKQIGSDNGKQFRYGYNLRDITKEAISTDIVTHVIVNYGEDLVNTQTFISPNAANYNRAIYGDIINDERITDVNTARKRAEAQFKDVSISYEQDIAELDEHYDLGETVHTIYEPFNDLSIVTRISKIREEWNGHELVPTTVTVGNYVFKTSDEILADMINESESSVKEEIEQTKEVIVREYRHELSETVTDLNKNITANYTSLINQTAQQIRLETKSEISRVDSNITTVQNNVARIDLKADQIQSTVTSHTTQIDGLGTRMWSAESSITQQANQIALKVSQTDYNGRTITSLINQDPYSVAITANRIDLNGAVMVRGSISGATSINVQENVTVGTTLMVGQDWQASYPKAIRFAGQFGSAGISYNNGSLTLSAINDINIDADRINILGTLSGTINSSSVNGYTMIYSTSGAKKYMTFRQNGSYLGQVELN